jgi:hypothetical protein
MSTLKTINVIHPSGTTNNIVLDSSGNVGIGTTPTSYGVTVRNAEAYIAGASGFTLVSANTASVKTEIASSESSLLGQVGTRTNHPVFFKTNDTERMRIDTSGNVGIGVSDPATYGSLAVYAGSAATSRQVIISPNSNSYNGQLSFLRLGTTVWNVGIDQADSNKFKIANSGTYSLSSGTAMTIDGSGNVGIGTTSPSAKLDVSGNVAILGSGGSATNRLSLTYNGTTGEATIGPNSTGGSTFLTLGTSSSGTYAERARIDSSGNLLVGGTTSPTGSGNIYVNTRVYVGTTNTDPTANRVNGVNILSGGSVYARANTSWDLGRDVTSGQHIGFYTDNGSARVTAGNISSNGNVTSYNTGSDYRLKEDVAPIIGGLQTISALKPVTYTWIGNKQKGEGFIAHELVSVIPLAVTGEKDAVKEDGSPDIQGVDYSKIVVHLVAAIQELKAQNDELKARVAALENA